jgi:endonuclease III
MQEIRQIVNKLTLTLDNPKSVKRQIKQINLAQKKLRAIKKEINELIRNINQDASQAFSVNLLGIGGLHRIFVYVTTTPIVGGKFTGGNGVFPISKSGFSLFHRVSR